MLRRVLTALALAAALAAPPSAAAQAVAPPAAPADTFAVAEPGAPAAARQSASAGSTGTSAASAASADTGRVAVPAPSEKAVRYFRSGNVLWVVGTLWGLLVPAVLLFTGLSARIRTLAQRIGRKWFFTVAVYIAILSALTWLVGLPLAYYVDFVREHQYGLSNQTAGKWLGDSMKALLLGIVGSALVLWVPYLLIRRSPRRWWLYTGLAAIPMIVFVFWFSPVFIDPLFNEFGPMDDQRLEARILALADRAGIEGGRVYQVDKSVDTNAVNAYVTGFGGSKRIVLWDTLLRRMNERETLFVMGHEMGHYVLRHVLGGIVLGSLLTMLSLYAVHRSAGWLIARYRHRFGFTELGDVASYPLLVLVIGVVGLAVAPVMNAFSRYAEHESDRFGLELTRDNHAAAMAFVKLQQENLAVPFPGTLYKLWRSSHPPLGERIRFANDYRPWETGQPLKYADRFEGGEPGGE
jgi:STE24 endopeptidase